MMRNSKSCFNGLREYFLSIAMNIHKQIDTGDCASVFAAVTCLLFTGDPTTACGFWPEGTPSSYNYSKIIYPANYILQALL